MTSTGAPRTGVVVVNHDTREELLGCLDSLAEAGADEVVVVDAGSADGSAEAVRARHPEAVLVELPNLGFARSANAGVARCRAGTIVVANADTRFAPGSVTALADLLEAHPEVAAVGPQVRYPDGRHQASARTLPSLGTALGHAALGLWWPGNPFTRRYRMVDADPSTPREVDWLSGCAVALRRDAFLQVGGFDPGYFMYVEDVDLGRRLREAGWRLRYDPTATVTHAVGASTSRAPGRMVVHHARSLDRFYGATYGRGAVGRALRPLVRLGLALWAGASVAWGRLVGRRTGRSSTGE